MPLLFCDVIQPHEEARYIIFIRLDIQRLGWIADSSGNAGQLSRG